MGERALVCLSDEGHREWTFGEVARTSGSLAALLVAHGIGRGSVVMTLLGNRIELVQTMLACLRLGAVTLPCSEQLRAKDVALRVQRARPSLVIADPRNADALAGVDVPVLFLPLAVPDVAPPPIAVCGPTDPAFVLFTSGTTGQPKLVTHGHRYIAGQRVQAEHWLAPHPGELVWSTAAPGWSKSTRNSFLAPWLAGAAAVLQDRRFDPGERLAVIRSEGVNVLCMAPTEYRLIAGAGPIGALPSLRRVVTAGEALGIPALTTWQEHTGLVISDGYGQTETGHLTSVPPGSTAPPGSMGRPLPGVQASVVGGELVVDPASVPTFFLGYDGSPAPEGPWHTGDQVEQDEDGWLYFRSRADDIIVSAGYRIGPAEVESVLLGHPAVQESAVIGVPDAQRGEVVCAVVVLAAGYEPSSTLERELGDFVKAETAPYKYPRVVRFVDALPKTTSGKTNRAQLR